MGSYVQRRSEVFSFSAGRKALWVHISLFWRESKQKNLNEARFLSGPARVPCGACGAIRKPYFFVSVSLFGSVVMSKAEMERKEKRKLTDHMGIARIRKLGKGTPMS